MVNKEVRNESRLIGHGSVALKSGERRALNEVAEDLRDRVGGEKVTGASY